MGFSLVFLFCTMLMANLSRAEACKDYPNGTADALHWYSCNGPDFWFETTSVIVLDRQGHNNYPVDFSKGVVLTANATNVGGVADRIISSARLWYWGNGLGFGECKWRALPTFGQTHRLDGCSISGNCPVQPGSAAIEQEVDFGPWNNIIATLASQTAYMLQVVSVNGLTSAHEPLACIVVQGMMK